MTRNAPLTFTSHMWSSVCSSSSSKLNECKTPALLTTASIMSDRISVSEFSPAPKAVLEIERATGDISSRKPFPHHMGALLRVLVASKPGSVVLHAGAGRSEVGAWLLHGLDIMSRLITISADPVEFSLSKKYVGNDLRVAVHSQDLLSFFSDVSQNRFDVVVFDARPEDLAVFDAALELLSPGGLFVSFDVAADEASCPVAVRECLGRWKDYCVSELPGLNGMFMASRRPPGARQSRRGNARRDRQRRVVRGPGT